MRSSAEAKRSRPAAALLLAGAALLWALAGAAPAAAQSAPKVWDGCAGGVAETQCSLPRGIAADPGSGELYVAEEGTHRVTVLDPWGGFVRAWGWGVADGAAEAQVCEEAESCQSGKFGSGSGQLSLPQGVAVDGAGDVYVVDWNNRRVQKFNPEGEFILMFGGDVNKTKADEAAPEAQRNLCTAASGDTCQRGVAGAGAGQFDWPPFGSLESSPGDYISIALPGGEVHVGDRGRIQIFNQAGAYQGDLPDPEGRLSGEVVQSLALDGSGNAFVAANDEENVLKLSPAGALLCEATVANPRGIALDGAGNAHVLDVDSDGVTVRRFGPDCSPSPDPDFPLPFEESFSQNTVGIATGAACLEEGTSIYLANAVFGTGFVRSYGPIPDPDLCPRPELAPLILDQFASSVGVSGATVRAAINPRFWEDTTYRVQYATAQCLQGPEDWDEPCVDEELSGGATLTSEIVNEPRGASAALGGLAPDTAYRYRFVAQSSGGGPVEGEGGAPGEEGAAGSFTTYAPAPGPDASCENGSLRSGLGALLPDCRAYEMATPVETNNGDIRADSDVSGVEQLFAQARPDGGKLTYSSSTSFAGGKGAPYVSQYIATRGGGGWQSENITPPRENNIPQFGAETPGNPAEFLDRNFRAFSEDLCTAWLFWDGDPPLGEAPFPGLEGYENLYERDNCDPGAGAYLSLLRSEPANLGPGTGEGSFRPRLGGLSADGSHAAYRANDALEVEEGTVAPNPGTNNQVYETYEDGKVRLVSVLPNGNPSGADNTVGNFGTYEAGRTDNAVSADGSRIFWTARGLFTRLFVRIEGSETKQVSTGLVARFEAAAADGSAALYSEGSNLRLYDVASGERTLLAGGVQGVVGASEDLSHVYFVSTQTLGAGPNERGDTPAGGQPNLFLCEDPAGCDDGGAGGAQFIGTLAGDEGSPSLSVTFSLTADRAVGRLSRVSADGEHLAFVSRAPLSGHDNTDAASGAPDTQVFRYAAPGGELDCLSCNPGGARPAGSPARMHGRGGGLAPKDVAGIIPGHAGHFHSRQVLSEDGLRVFFESFDSLLPRDTNGKLDVYQWQAPGKGECEASHPYFFAELGGCLALISTGKGAGGSEFIDATPSGEDVFFRTSSSLVEEDPGNPGLEDIYDARVGGGFAPPPAGEAGCEGDACQSAEPAPEFPTPASAAIGPVGAPAQPSPCRRAARRARRLSGQAKRTRRAARRARGARPVRRLRRAAQGRAKRAHRASRSAKRCRARLRAARASQSGRAAR